jgi:dTMP kinase
VKHTVSFELEFRKHNYPGKLIVFEGIDGSGKTTQAKILENMLEERNIKTFFTKNPTDHTIGRLIREVLAGREKIPAQARQYLFCADRVVQEKEIIAALKKGHIVISDRYFWSSVAYGMADIGKIDERLLTAYSILSFYKQFILPDLTIFLDVDVAAAVKRFSQKERKEIYEKKSFLEKVKKNYDYLLTKFPDEFCVINSGRALGAVSRDIFNKVEPVLK